MLITYQDSVILLRALLEVRAVVHLLVVATLTTLVCKDFACNEEMNIFLLFIDCVGSMRYVSKASFIRGNGHLFLLMIAMYCGYINSDLLTK